MHREGGEKVLLLTLDIAALHKVDVYALANRVDADQPSDLAGHCGSSDEVISNTDRERCRQVGWLTEFLALDVEAAVLVIKTTTSVADIVRRVHANLSWPVTGSNLALPHDHHIKHRC